MGKMKKNKKKQSNPYKNINKDTINRMSLSDMNFNPLVILIMHDELMQTTSEHFSETYPEDFAEIANRLQRKVTLHYDKARELIMPAVNGIVEKGYFPSIDDVLGGDRIYVSMETITDIDKSLQENNSALVMSPEEAFYNVIPCYNKGSFILPFPAFDHKDDIICTSWEIKSLDLKDLNFRMDLTVSEVVKGQYIPVLSIENMIVAPRDQYDIDGRHDINVAYVADAKTVIQGQTHIMSQVPYAKLGWSSDVKTLWKTLVINSGRVEKEDVMDTVDFALSRFDAMSFRVNRVLSEASLSHPKPTGNHPEYNIVPNSKNKQTSERKVRVCGDLKFVSKMPPRRPGRKTAEMIYKTAAWTVRGHVRHYKSGKTAYIAPRVNRRKALRDIVQDPVVAKSVVEVV